MKSKSYMYPSAQLLEKKKRYWQEWGEWVIYLDFIKSVGFCCLMAYSVTSHVHYPKVPAEAQYFFFYFFSLFFFRIFPCISHCLPFSRHISRLNLILLSPDSIMREEQYQWQIVDRIQMGHSSSSVMANNLTLTWNTLCLESMSQVVKSQCYITLKTSPWTGRAKCCKSIIIIRILPSSIIKGK